MLYSNRSRFEGCLCEANGCTWAASTRLPMCLKHWHQVPGPMQADIWMAYRAMPQKTPLRTELMQSLLFTAAMASAVEHVARAERKPDANAFRDAAQLLGVEMCEDADLLDA